MAVPKFISSLYNWFSYNALSFCARRGWHWSLEKLVGLGLNADAVSPDGMLTLLQTAAESTDDKTVCALLNAGANPNKIGADVNEISALQYAIINTCGLDTIESMIKKGADLNYKSKRAKLNALDYAEYYTASEGTVLSGVIKMLKHFGATHSENFADAMFHDLGIRVDQETLAKPTAPQITPLREGLTASAANTRAGTTRTDSTTSVSIAEPHSVRHTNTIA